MNDPLKGQNCLPDSRFSLDRHDTFNATTRVGTIMNSSPALAVGLIVIAIVIGVVGYVRNLVRGNGTQRKVAPAWQTWLLAGISLVCIAIGIFLLASSN